MSVNHTSASIPIALRMAMARRWISAVGHGWLEWDERFVDPFDGAALAQRELRAVGTRSASRESRSMVRCCVSVSTIIRVKAATTRSRRAATSVGRVSGSSDSAAVSGWAAASRARWLGKYR